jgi:hypothetical protein
MDKIKLNLINKSADTNNSSIVIFEKNVAEDFEEIAVAWQVIKNLGRLGNHPFVYPLSFQVGAEDSYGNFTPQMNAYYGQAFEMILSTSGDILQLDENPATNVNEVEIKNNLVTGSISANCYKDGKLFATKKGVAPGQKAVFEFHPTIYVGVVSQIDEGDVMNAAVISQINTQIDLLGITSADIVMTGGGSGENATPFVFTLENVNML